MWTVQLGVFANFLGFAICFFNLLKRSFPASGKTGWKFQTWGVFPNLSYNRCLCIGVLWWLLFYCTVATWNDATGWYEHLDMSYVVPWELVNGAFYFNDSILLSHRAWIFPLMSFSFKWQLVFSIVIFNKLHPWRSLYELQRPSIPPASASGPSWPGGQNLQTLCAASTCTKTASAATNCWWEQHDHCTDKSWSHHDSTM